MADLSEIGLTGLNSHAQRTLMAAQANQLQSSAAKDDFEIEVAKRTQRVAEQAAASLQDPDASMSGGVGGGGGQKLQSLADPLANVGMIFLKAGLPEQGAKYINNASEIRRRESQDVSDVVTNQKNRLENMSKGAELVGTWLGQAKNQLEWEAGLDEVAKVLPQEAEQLRAMNGGQYHPEVAAYLREKAISVKDQARLDMDMVEEQGRQSRHLNSLANEDERIELQRQRDADLNAYRERLLKASGGKTAAQVAPNSDAVKEARSALISGGYFKSTKKVDPELDDASAFIANETAQELKNVPGLSRNSAQQRAIMRAVAKGKFKVEGEDSAPVFGFGGSEAKRSFNRFSGEGKTQAEPLPIPPKGTRLAKGSWYTLPDGSVGQFDGKDFVIP